MHPKSALFALVLTIAVIGCRSTPTEGVAVIGPSGGTIAIPGATLTIPAGALATDRTISITATHLAAPDGYELYSPVFDFEPSGIVFMEPVVITLTFPAASDAHLYWSRATGDGYDETPSTSSSGSVTASITHFSSGFAGRLLEGGDEDAGGTDDAGDNDAGSDAATDEDAAESTDAGDPEFDPDSTVRCTVTESGTVTASQDHVALTIVVAPGAGWWSDDLIPPGDFCGYDAGAFPRRTGRALMIQALGVFSAFRGSAQRLLALDCAPPHESWVAPHSCGGTPLCTVGGAVTVTDGSATTLDLTVTTSTQTLHCGGQAAATGP